MSTIGTRHTLIPFVAGTSKANADQRLSKIGYKKTKEQPNPPASVCASVPFIANDAIENHVDRLLPHIRTMLESAQDGIVRSLYESSGHELIGIDDADISVGACISYLQAEAAGDRLRKDQILAWFDAEISENLTVFVAELLRFDDLTPDALRTVNKHVGIYRDLIGMLAGGKTILEQKQINGCKKAIGLCGNADDRIAARLVARLEQMEAPKVRIELLDLGD